MLTARERERLKVLHEVRKGHIRQRQAAAELGVSVHWVKELARRLREVGDRAVVHGLKGRVSNRRIEEEVKQKALRRLKERHRDYGPTLAAEVLEEELGVMVSRETVRKWLVEAGLWRPKRVKLKRVHGRQAPACEADVHRRLRPDQKLASILSHVESRQVGNDYTVSWRGRKFQIPLAEAKPRMRGQAVRVEQRLNGELWAAWQGREIRLQECVPAPASVRTVAPAPNPPQTKGVRRRWMDGFWIGDPAKRRPSPVTPVALRAPSATGDP